MSLRHLHSNEKMVDQNNIPHLMKYMGSKREILEFITSSIDELNIESNGFVTYSQEHQL